MTHPFPAPCQTRSSLHHRSPYNRSLSRQSTTLAVSLSHGPAMRGQDGARCVRKRLGTPWMGASAQQEGSDEGQWAQAEGKGAHLVWSLLRGEERTRAGRGPWVSRVRRSWGRVPRRLGTKGPHSCLADKICTMCGLCTIVLIGVSVVTWCILNSSAGPCAPAARVHSCSAAHKLRSSSLTMNVIS